MRGVIGTWSPSTLHLVLFAVGGGLVYVGQEWGVPYATDIGVALLGVLLVAAGLDLIIKKLGVFRIDGWTSSNVVETYRGISEMLWGLLFIGIGLAVLAVSVGRWLFHAGADTIWADVLGSSLVIGIALAFAGLLLSLNGLVHVLSGRTGIAGSVRGFSDLMDRLVGVMHLLAGLMVFGVAFLIMVPGALTAVVEQVRKLLAGG
jgi:hypothetical protein